MDAVRIKTPKWQVTTALSAATHAEIMIRMFRLVTFFVCAAAAGFAQSDGKALFELHCATCHKAGTDNRAPLPEALAARPNQAIVVALESGIMKAQAANLTAAQRQAIADYLSPRTAAAVQMAKDSQCAGNAPALKNVNGWNGWSTDLVNTRLQTSGGLRAQDV